MCFLNQVEQPDKDKVILCIGGDNLYFSVHSVPYYVRRSDDLMSVYILILNSKRAYLFELTCLWDD